jgi:hypothetical protein
MQPRLRFEDGPIWTQTRDGDPQAREIFHRHYSRYIYADGRDPKQFVGPGQYICLVTPEYDALFVWRKFINRDNQEGVNCAVFRNESRWLSSDLIKAADVMAFQRWPGERHYTYVNPRKIRSTNPGYCFIQAGWRRLPTLTKARKLHILELLPEWGIAEQPDWL